MQENSEFVGFCVWVFGREIGLRGGTVNLKVILEFSVLSFVISTLQLIVITFMLLHALPQSIMEGSH